MDAIQRQSYNRPKPWTVKQEVISDGVACCRYNEHHIAEILIICKRTTYAFVTLVLGKYRATDTQSIIMLLDKTTVEEKQCLMTLDYSLMWHRTWLQQTHRAGLYAKTKARFEANWLFDGGTKLVSLCKRAKSIRCAWEVPKGRRKNGEAPVSCAVREFEEETGNKKSTFCLLSFDPHKYTFCDAGVRYTYNYYIASSIRAAARIDLGSDNQCGEISDIRWADLNAIRVLDSDGRLLEVCADLLAKYREGSGT